MSTNPSAERVNWQPAIPVDQSIYEESTTQKTTLGTRIKVGNTSYVYCKINTNVNAGNCLVLKNSAVVNKATVGATVVAGTYEVPLYASNNQTANAFADAYLTVMDSGGAGHTYRIKSHAAITATTVSQMVTLYDPIASDGAMTAATKITVCPDPYASVYSGTDVGITAPFVGASPIAATSGNYIWAACEGPAPVLVGGNVTYGAKVAVGATGAALALNTTANATGVIGVSLTLTGTADDAILCWLNGGLGA